MTEILHPSVVLASYSSLNNHINNKNQVVMSYTDKNLQEYSTVSNIPASPYEHIESLMQGQADILEMISRHDPLPVILEAITTWVEKQSDTHLLASILLTDSEEKYLLHGAAPSLPAAYNEAINGVRIDDYVGSCGTAAFRKTPVIVEDIERDPLWKDFKHIAAQHGLKACWSTPLINKNGNVLGTFAIYYKEVRKPEGNDLDIIRLVNRTAVMAIEHHRTEAERLRLADHEAISIKKMQQERASFQKMIMDAPAMIAILKGPEHVYDLTNTFYNAAVAGKRQLIGKSIREALPELADQNIYEILDNVYQTGVAYEGDEFLVQLDLNNDGVLEDKYFNFVFSALRDSKQEIEGLMIHATDVTGLVQQRKRAEESEDLFRSFVLNAPSPIGIYIGREMRIQTANEAILNAWGKDASVIGKTFKEALPELEGQGFYTLLDNVYTTGVTYNAKESRVDLVRNGKMEITYYNFTYKALKDEAGNIFGVINTAEEVTDMVLAKRKLSQAEEDLRNAIDVAELGTWSLSLPDKIITISGRLKEWYGTIDNASFNDALENVIHHDDTQKVADALKHSLDTLENYAVEYRSVNPVTGEEKNILSQGKIYFDEEGVPYKMSGTHKDITLQKVTEHALEKLVELRTVALKESNIQLQYVNENLKQFAYIASHDLQEPLRKVNIFADLLSTSNKDLDEKSRLHINKIRSAAQRMADLINDLLEFSRLDAKENGFMPVNLDTIMHNVLIDYEVTIEQKNALINMEPLPFIEAVPLQMNQLFYNLIGNALKFTKEHIHPVITVSSRILSQEEILKYDRLNSRWPHCEIVISDNGIGFDPIFSEKIFVIFQRLHVKNKYQGTGIGLALCKKIAENHNGEIFSHSEPGEGASFYIILPVSRPAN